MTTTPTETEAAVPVPVDERRSELRNRLEAASHLLCCLDFDGTLAPIVEDPDAARIPESTRGTLERLHADPNVTVAIVSGRAVADLRRRIELPVSLVGNHGLERYDPPGPDGSGGDGLTVHPLAAAAIPRIDTCCGVLESALDPIPNAAVEHKGLTGTVHYRTVPEPLQSTCKWLAIDVLERIGGDRLSISEGNAIVEFGPAIDWGKGDAVELLRAEHARDTVVLVCGDDTTDEDAFRVLNGADISIQVGDPRPSHGAYRTASPATLATFLEWLADDGTDLLGT